MLYSFNILGKQGSPEIQGVFDVRMTEMLAVCSEQHMDGQPPTHFTWGHSLPRTGFQIQHVDAYANRSWSLYV